MGKINNAEKEQNMIKLSFEKEEAQSGQALVGMVSIIYEGRFDSVSINSQIENSSDVFSYTELQGKKVNYPYARLSIMKKDIINLKDIKFKVITQHEPDNDTSIVKFRVTLIQEHKEIGSDVKFIRIRKG